MTAGSLLHAILPEPDGGPSLRRFFPHATPALLGIERSNFVLARHPQLAATADDGEGISPYGFTTNIPCSITNDSCDASLGMVCSNAVFGGSDGTCAAYPVVQKDQLMVLRGFNFWDVAEARVIFEPLVSGQGTESTAVISILDPNEPSSPDAACVLPGIGNPTHNRAHFRVPANEGHFYRVRMFNHNGQFLTQQDGIDHGESRVIHTCYPQPGPDLDDVPAGTNRDCTFPLETCQQDGPMCAGTWATPPRRLEDCRHAPGSPPPCGETPEWYEAKPMSPRADGISLTESAIVFVEAESPVFELTGTLHAMEALEETGVDFLGSDEPMFAIVGASFGEAQEIPDVENLTRRFRGSYDEGDRKIEDFELIGVEVPVDESAVFLAILLEDDGFAAAFAAGLLGIAIAAAIIILSGGLTAVAAAGGAAGVTLLWGLLVSQFHAEDDLMGMESFSASPFDVSGRIGASHADDFLSTQPPLLGALPEVQNGAREGVVRSQLIHPFEEFSVGNEPLEAACPGQACPTGQECRTNRCVPAGFVDPTANVAFRERREYNNSGGRYAVDLQWAIRKK